MIKDVKKLVGDNCKRLREQKGMTQEVVAEKAGLSLSYISEVERGNANPTLTTAEKIAQGLETDIAEVLDFKYGQDSPQEIRQRLLEILSTADDKTISGLYATIIKAFHP